MKGTATLFTQICILFSLLFATASCKTVYTFESLSPAKYTLPQGVDTVLIVCGVPPAVWSDTAQCSSPIKKAEIVDAEIKFPFVTTSILYSEMNKYGFLPAKLHKYILEAERIPALADSLCRANNTNAIMVLSSISYKRTDKLYADGEKLYVVKQYIDEYTNDPDLFADSTTLVTATCQWTFVTPNGNSRQFETITTSPYWGKPNDISLSMSYNPIPGDRQTCFAAASDLSFKMVGELTPSWIKVNRFLFYSQKKSFLNAMDMISLNQWNEARALLSSIFENGRTRNKVHAALDMSLSFEKEGDIDAASIWCSKALDILDSAKFLKFEREYAKELFNMLEIRKNEIARLDKQMNKRQ